MKHQTELIPTDEAELAALPPIKQDAIAEEVYAARRYSKRITRTVIMTQGIVSVLLALAVVGLAMRPAKRVYIKLDACWTSDTDQVFGHGALHARCGDGEDLSQRLGAVPLWPSSRERFENLPEELSFS